MIIAVLVLPVAIGLAALAVEGGLWYADRHELRAMADGGAMAAAWARYDEDDEEDAATDAVDDMGFNDDTDEIEVNSPPLEGLYEGDDDAIEIVMRRFRPLMLSTMFLGGESVEIVMRAVVRMGSRSAYCVLALSRNASAAVSFQGGPTVDLQGCGINANSVEDDALSMGGTATLTADWAQVVGGIELIGRARLITHEDPEESAPNRADPFADLPEPPRPPDCPGGAVAVYTPCTFVGNKTLNAGTSVTLSPGVYYVDAGTFRVNGGATLIGDGVTLYLTNGANMVMNGGANVSLTAPSTGTYAGIAVMQDRDDPPGTSQFNGGSTMDIQGVVYMPTQHLQFNGGNTLGGGCTRLISDTMVFSGNAVMGNNCSGLGLPETINDEPRLVE